jgi:hypothetical protein
MNCSEQRSATKRLSIPPRNRRRCLHGLLTFAATMQRVPCRNLLTRAFRVGRTGLEPVTPCASCTSEASTGVRCRPGLAADLGRRDHCRSAPTMVVQRRGYSRGYSLTPCRLCILPLAIQSRPGSKFLLSSHLGFPAVQWTLSTKQGTQPRSAASIISKPQPLRGQSDTRANRAGNRARSWPWPRR